MPEIKKQARPLLKPYLKKEPAVYDRSWERMDRNESGLGVSPKVSEAIASELEYISRYPENTGWVLRKALADYYALEPDQVLIGNGSFELLWLIASVLLDEKSESVITSPTFGWYKTYSSLLGGRVVNIPLADLKIDLEGVRRAVNSNTRVIWLCNPNNPTGEYLEEMVIDAFLSGIPPYVTVVLDEAYLEFVDGYTAGLTIDLVRKYNNVLILRTFSKFYGLASLRIGYALGDKEMLNALLQFRVPPNHSRLAEAAASASIQDVDFQESVRCRFRAERAFLYGELAKLGLNFVRTQAVYMLIKLGKEKVIGFLKELESKKILVKNGAEFGLPDYLRLSIKSHAANVRFIENLKNFLDRENEK